MGLIYDSPDLAALTLTRLAAEESEGPGTLEGRMRNYLDGLGQAPRTSNWWPSRSPGSTSSPWTTWPGPPGQTPRACSTPRKSKLLRGPRRRQAYSVQVEITGTIQSPDGSYKRVSVQGETYEAARETLNEQIQERYSSSSSGQTANLAAARACPDFEASHLSSKACSGTSRNAWRRW
jgi:hypothetical protein